jgi:hypothetical protein
MLKVKVLNWFAYSYNLFVLQVMKWKSRSWKGLRAGEIIGSDNELFVCVLV